jgi:hypothetical protein
MRTVTDGRARHSSDELSSGEDEEAAGPDTPQQDASEHRSKNVDLALAASSAARAAGCGYTDSPA